MHAFLVHIDLCTDYVIIVHARLVTHTRKQIDTFCSDLNKIDPTCPGSMEFRNPWAICILLYDFLILYVMLSRDMEVWNVDPRLYVLVCVFS